MDEEFSRQVEEAVDAARKNDLKVLGTCALVSRVPHLLSKRLRGHRAPAPIALGDALRSLLGEVIVTTKPPGEQRYDDPSWRNHLFLHYYVALRWSVDRIETEGVLGLRRAAMFELRKSAMGALALALWHLEEEAAPAPVRHNLPRCAYPGFVPRRDSQGRDCVEWIIEQLCSGRSWVVAVDGPPGVGKTTVAREVAERCLERELFEAIVWASAQYQAFYPPNRTFPIEGGVTCLDNILDLIGKALDRRDIKEAPNRESKLKAVHEVLAATNCLVIIDNLESVTEEAQKEIFTFLLQNLPAPSQALVAGRQGDYPGQVTVTIPGMELPQALAFMRAAAKLHGLAALSYADACRIHDATQGNPLAMQGAIGLIQGLGYSVDDAMAFSGLTSEMLDYMYAGAYRKLSESDRQVLHVMPIFVDPASRDAIGAASGNVTSHLSVALARLYRAFLVQQVEGRYDILPFPRQFLRTVQARPGATIDGASLSEFLLQAHRDLSRYYADALGHMIISERLDFLRQERNNVLAVMRWCYETDEHELLVDLVRVMSWPLCVLGYFSDRITWAKRAIKAAGKLRKPDLALWFTVYDLAWTYARTDGPQKGERMIRKALQKARKHGYKRVEALALRNLGRLIGDRGDLDEAVRYLEESLALWQELKDPEWLAHTVAALGFLKVCQRDWLAAEQLLQEAVKLHKRIGYSAGEITALSDLALVKAEQGDEARARELSEQALAMGASIEKPAPPYAYALWRRAQLDEKLGECSASVCARGEEACRIYRDASAHHWAAEVRKWLDERRCPPG